MLTKLTSGLIAGLVNIIKVVVLVVIAVGIIKWAQAHPAQWQALVDRLITALIGVVDWVLTQITTLVGG